MSPGRPSPQVREWLKPSIGSGGIERTSLLRLMVGRCPSLVRTLPALVFDEHKAEDCDSDGEDHAADALRYGLMSRPAPKLSPKPNPPSDFDARAAYKLVEDRRRRVRYIGHEGELMEVYGRNRR